MALFNHDRAIMDKATILTWYLAAGSQSWGTKVEKKDIREQVKGNIYGNKNLFWR